MSSLPPSRDSLVIAEGQFCRGRTSSGLTYGHVQNRWSVKGLLSAQICLVGAFELPACEVSCLFSVRLGFDSHLLPQPSGLISNR